MFECRLCRKNFKLITNTHLASIHGISLHEYMQKFGSLGAGFLSPNLLPHTNPRYKKWLNSLKKRPPPWSKGYTKETHPSLAKISKTFREEKIDNFKRWRTEAKLQGKIPTQYPPLKKNKELAFLIGLILGDGNIYRFPRTEGLRIALGTDKPLLWKFAARTVMRVFSKKPYVAKVKKSNCMTITLYQNLLSERFAIPAGDRSKLKIKLPQWIWKNNGFLIACIKGLFEAEGSFSIHLPTGTYNLAFSNKNENLLNEVEKALHRLGFHPERRPVAVRIRKRREAFAFAKLISFRKYTKL